MDDKLSGSPDSKIIIIPIVNILPQTVPNSSFSLVK